MPEKITIVEFTLKEIVINDVGVKTSNRQTVNYCGRLDKIMADDIKKALDESLEGTMKPPEKNNG
jgi:hypothetical protein